MGVSDSCVCTQADGLARILNQIQRIDLDSSFPSFLLTLTGCPSK